MLNTPDRTKNIVCTSGVKHFYALSNIVALPRAARASTFSRGRNGAILRPWYKNNYLDMNKLINYKARYTFTSTYLQVQRALENK